MIFEICFAVSFAAGSYDLLCGPDRLLMPKRSQCNIGCPADLVFHVPVCLAMSNKIQTAHLFLLSSVTYLFRLCLITGSAAIFSAPVYEQSIS